MTKLGEIKQGAFIGKKHSPYRFYVWVQCRECKNERWGSVQSTKMSYYTGLCQRCLGKRKFAPFTRYGKEHVRWQGGRHKDKGGYIVVYIYPDNPYYSMASKRGYIREHRLVMAKHLSRCLKPSETVHHINGVRDDNRIENLLLSINGEHIKLHHKVVKELGELRRQVETLKTRNRELDCNIAKIRRLKKK